MIDEQLQNKLRSLHNPDGSELRNHQLRMLEMLKYIDDICVKLNIQYWLSSGTCLGAVRHGGFIPWDDDVDIEMFDDDYNRLVGYLKEHETDSFVLQTHANDKNYLQDFGKLRDKKSHIEEELGFDSQYQYKGIYIDIFRISPSNSRFLHYLGGRIRILELYVKKWSINNNFLQYLFPIMRYFNNCILGIFGFVDRIGAKNKLRHRIGVPFLSPRYLEDVSSIIRVPFEGYNLPIPKGYDHYLKLMFGDYWVMKPTHVHIKKQD